MENLSAADLAALVRQHCPDVADETCDLIVKNRVSGKRAITYTASDWTFVGLPYGDVVDIMQVLKDIHSRNSLSTSERDESNKENFLEIPNPNDSCVEKIPVVIKELSTLHDGGQSSSAFESLQEYFSTTEWNEMSTYEKQSYMNKKENYEHALTLGINLSGPSFMQRKSNSNKVQKSNENLAGSSKTPGKLTMVTRLNKCKQGVREESNSQESTSEQQEAPFDHQVVTSERELITSDHQAPTSEDQSIASETRATTSEHQAATSVDEDSSQDYLDSSTNVENNEKDSDQPASSKKRRRRRRVKPHEHLPDDEYAEKLVKFDVDAILLGRGDGLKDVRQALKDNGIVYSAQRKFMMRTLTYHLFFDEAGKVKRVTTDDKSGMAASIVRSYPKFKDNSNPNKRSWWRIFDPQGPSGYIANCTTTIFRKLKPEDRFRGGGQGSLVTVESDEDREHAGPSETPENFHDSNAEWMSLTMPFTSKKQDLLNGMEASFQTRRKWIKAMHPSVTEILQKYPHLMSFGSEMLEKEFNAMYPEKGALFLRLFPQLVQAVKSKGNIVEVEDFEVGDTRDIIGTCLAIAKKLPRPNLQRYKRKKESVMPTLDTIFVTAQLGTNIKDAVKQRREGACSPVQPYLIALAPNKKITKLFLVADNDVLELPLPSVLSGLDILFKTYHVFDVEYPLGWKVFWEMIEHGLLQIQPEKLTNSAKELLLLYNILP